MKVKIENVEWFAPEVREGTVTFTAGSLSLQAYTCGPEFKIGMVVEVGFDHLSGPTDWPERFSGNPLRKKCLVSTGRWCYDAFGQIASVSPVVADFGVLHLALGDWTHDECIVGEYIFWRIGRLDIFPEGKPNQHLQANPETFISEPEHAFQNSSKPISKSSKNFRDGQHQQKTLRKSYVSSYPFFRSKRTSPASTSAPVRWMCVGGGALTASLLYLGGTWPSFFTLIALAALPSPFIFLWAVFRPSVVQRRRGLRLYLLASCVTAAACWLCEIWWLHGR